MIYLVDNLELFGAFLFDLIVFSSIVEYVRKPHKSRAHIY